MAKLTQAQIDSAQAQNLSPQEFAKRFLSILGDRVPASQPETATWAQILTVVEQVLSVSTPAGTGGTGACVYKINGTNRCASPMTQSECDRLGGTFFPGDSC